jgi:hypothetical protein
LAGPSVSGLLNFQSSTVRYNTAAELAENFIELNDISTVTSLVARSLTVFDMLVELNEISVNSKVK